MQPPCDSITEAAGATQERRPVRHPSMHVSLRWDNGRDDFIQPRRFAVAQSAPW